MTHLNPSQRAYQGESRRRFLGSAGKVTLSATAIALIAGSDSLAASHSGGRKSDPAQDTAILNVALGLEHEAINAYRLGAESGLLQKPVLDVAVLFQGHHKAHRDALADTVKKLGGTAVAAKKLADYASDLKANTLKNQTDVLKLAARLERGAANAYIGVIPAFGDADLAQIAGRLAADETMHWTVLANALGQPVPKAALTFGV
ncbi:MAG: DUF4439 domain-containing protein [Alphaproteobacteria bacterium]|nr:DUF4439 domain-containing protein [Alphaproteobacteria bacterium]